MCQSLTGIVIPSGVTSIGDSAFADCTNVTSITIPNSVTSIGANAFYNCTNLTIYCYADSAAEQYAIDNSIPYELITDTVLGDVDGDGAIDTTDYATLFRANKGADVTVGAGADVNGNGLIDNLDYSLLRRMLKGTSIS